MGKSRQVALVIGASSGIGRATAYLFAVSGFRVFGTSRTQQPDTDGVEMQRLDVTSDESVTRCFKEVLMLTGHIDVLVNNAGV
jgi:NAD(P)-dependent dehydrogenase (short-subunit alcohol dehydrogenase family)